MSICAFGGLETQLSRGQLIARLCSCQTRLQEVIHLVRHSSNAVGTLVRLFGPCTRLSSDDRGVAYPYSASKGFCILQDRYRYWLYRAVAVDSASTPLYHLPVARKPDRHYRIRVAPYTAILLPGCKSGVCTRGLQGEISPQDGFSPRISKTSDICPDLCVSRRALLRVASEEISVLG